MSSSCADTHAGWQLRLLTPADTCCPTCQTGQNKPLQKFDSVCLVYFSPPSVGRRTLLKPRNLQHGSFPPDMCDGEHCTCVDGFGWELASQLFPNSSNAS